MYRDLPDGVRGGDHEHGNVTLTVAKKNTGAAHIPFAKSHDAAEYPDAAENVITLSADAAENLTTTRRIQQLNLRTGNVIHTFSSAIEVEQTLGFGRKTIIAVVRGSYKTSHGFRWRYEITELSLIHI